MKKGLSTLERNRHDFHNYAPSYNGINSQIETATAKSFFLEVSFQDPNDL